jgi:hypothetical protein
MLGSPWFWRAYIGLLLGAALAMRLTRFEFPEGVRQVGLCAIIEAQAFTCSTAWRWEGRRGAHRKP